MEDGRRPAAASSRERSSLRLGTQKPFARSRLRLFFTRRVASISVCKDKILAAWLQLAPAADDSTGSVEFRLYVLRYSDRPSPFPEAVKQERQRALQDSRVPDV